MSNFDQIKKLPTFYADRLQLKFWQVSKVEGTKAIITLHLLLYSE